MIFEDWRFSLIGVIIFIVKEKRQSPNIKEYGFFRNNGKQFKYSHSSKMKSELKTDNNSGPDNSKFQKKVNPEKSSQISF